MEEDLQKYQAVVVVMVAPTEVPGSSSGDGGSSSGDGGSSSGDGGTYRSTRQ